MGERYLFFFSKESVIGHSFVFAYPEVSCFSDKTTRDAAELSEDKAWLIGDCFYIFLFFGDCLFEKNDNISTFSFFTL
ncbi:hypothetical protein ACM44_13090 [Chryseobacterium koreense CCUG 49689]|uniref:Uncharacterized protein n=1 Tax=Chryseobacterium koreense CCUG 49689 TaxID=1304281 RepID=A0A0J7IVE8_9FLAO|nr:hypothetical protein ACM44_13090 [Chryseobacterium koreense CCUG 49689]